MKTLEGKTAIITGASSGIGYETAKLFAAHGANLILNGRRLDALEVLAAEICDQNHRPTVRPVVRPVVIASDITNEGAAQHLVETALNEFGKLDIAFNNAGIMGNTGPLIDMSADDWRTTLDTNLTSAFFNAKHQIPALLQCPSGSLIFTSSFVGHTIGMPGMSAYGASKAGLIGLTKNLAAEYSPEGLRVNALLPGGTDTPMSITNGPDADPDALAFIEGLHALKRLATPMEIARAALFLASDAASFVTGTAMLVDGGVSINKT